MKLQYFIGKLVIKKIGQETTEVSEDQKKKASGLDLAWTETFDLTELQLGRPTGFTPPSYTNMQETLKTTTETLKSLLQQRTKAFLKFWC